MSIRQEAWNSSATTRLLSLDAYRGFTMLAMVSGGLGFAKFLNDPTWGWLVDQLEHRDWIGCTAWDLIQPSFMFIVGAAMPFAFALRKQRGDSWGKQLLHAARRSLVLIFIGVLLDSLGHPVIFLQLIRVLQQIAIGYFLAFLVLNLGPVTQAAAAILILLSHSALFWWYGQTTQCWPWEEGLNIGTVIDQCLNLPLSTGGYVTFNAVSATATILFGVLCGELLRSPWPTARKLMVLGIAGVGGLWLGLAMTPCVPMVKRLWTASFTVYAGGWTCLMMLAFYVLIDVARYQKWCFIFMVVGMNSIAIYVVSSLFKQTISQVVTPWVGTAFGPTAITALLARAFLIVFVQWAFCYWLYRHRIFFKV